jgi:hypothetical protein
MGSFSSSASSAALRRRAPGYNFVLAFLQFARQKRRKNSFRLEAGGQFFDAFCIKAFAGIGC